jgi:protein involved in ribonucleotide reduction
MVNADYPSNRYPYLFILTILSVLLTPEVKGQSQVKGKIEDENGRLMPYATVLLLSPADSSSIRGVVTTANGTFEMNDVAAGDYLLSAQTVGYTPTYVLPTAQARQEMRVSALYPFECRGVHSRF